MEERRCPNCGSIVDEKYDICSECGSFIYERKKKNVNPEIYNDLAALSCVLGLGSLFFSWIVPIRFVYVISNMSKLSVAIVSIFGLIPILAIIVSQICKKKVTDNRAKKWAKTGTTTGIIGLIIEILISIGLGIIIAFEL